MGLDIERRGASRRPGPMLRLALCGIALLAGLGLFVLLGDEPRARAGADAAGAGRATDAPAAAAGGLDGGSEGDAGTEVGSARPPAPERIPAAPPAALLATARILAVSERGAAIPEARVLVLDEGAPPVEAADWPYAGSVTCAGAAPLRCSVTAPGWGAAPLSLAAEEIAASRTGEVRVVLAPPRVRWGRLFGPSGEPRGGERLRLVFGVGSEANVDTACDLDGWFPYAEESADLRLAKAFGHSSFRGPKRWVSRSLESLRIARQDPLELVADDRPGLALRIRPEELAGRTAYDVQRRGADGATEMLGAVRTGEGVFVELASDGEHELRVGCAGWASDWSPVRMTQGVAQPALLDVELLPRAAWRGRVVAPRGEPVAGAWVALDHWPRGLAEHEWWLTNSRFDADEGAVAPPPPGMGIERTDALGGFEIPFRLGRLVVHHPAYAAAVLDPDAWDGSPIVLREGSVLEGRVVGRTELLESEGPLSVETHGPGFPGPFGAVIQQARRLAADGSFRLTALRPGRNTVSVTTPGGDRLACEVVDVALDAVTRVEIAIDTLQAVRLRVPGTGGLVSWIELKTETSEVLPVRCAGDGDLWSGRVPWTGATAVHGHITGRNTHRLGTIEIVPGRTDYQLEWARSVVRVAVHAASGAGEHVLSIRAQDAQRSMIVSGRAVEPGAWTEVRDVPQGKYLAVVSRRDEGQPVVALAGFEVPGMPSVVDVQLQAATRTLDCRVTAAGGAPLEGLAVFAAFADVTVGGAATDAGGLARLGVPAGVPLLVWADSRQVGGPRTASVEVAPAHARVDLVALETVSVEIRVRRGDAPSAGLVAALEFLDGEDYGFERQLAFYVDGVMGPMFLLPGRWRLRTVAGDFQDVVVTDEAEQVVTVSFPG